MIIRHCCKHWPSGRIEFVVSSIRRDVICRSSIRYFISNILKALLESAMAYPGGVSRHIGAVLIRFGTDNRIQCERR